jgi:hypothetical protein
MVRVIQTDLQSLTSPPLFLTQLVKHPKCDNH